MYSGFNRVCGLLIASILMLPVFAQAAPVCATGTLASVISVGSCTIGDATFDFGTPSFGSYHWFSGPYAGDTVLGPSASQVAFTPIFSATSAGFSLTGPFSVSAGNRADVQFGYVVVSTPLSSLIVGVNLAMTGASVSGDSADNLALVNDSGHVAVYDTGNGSQLLDAAALSPGNLLWDNLFMRTWNYSTNPGSVVAFTGFTYSVDLQSTAPVDPGTPVPEPATLSLMGLALAGLAVSRRNRK